MSKDFVITLSGYELQLLEQAENIFTNAGCPPMDISNSIVALALQKAAEVIGNHMLITLPAQNQLKNQQQVSSVSTELKKPLN